MLTDMIVEEEFEIKEDEPWYDKQDLEHDLHLAAELGKTLLERNRELEQGLQQMYATNQEQLQEIEYLSKQVDFLRSVNDQHAKVYEQLDLTARDLEKTNQRLVLENRSAQQKIVSLTDTIDGLQTQVEELQKQVEELRSAEADRQDLGTPQQSSSHQSVSCLKDQNQSKKSVSPTPQDKDWEEGERMALLRSVRTLQAQLRSEQVLRQTTEQEAEALAREIAELEPRLALLETCQSRLAELETEVEELRQLWRSEASSGSGVSNRLVPEAVFIRFEEVEEKTGWREHKLRRSSSEKQLRACGSADVCIRDADDREGRRGVLRSEAVKQRGISLLNEVDAQYSALQVKYDALLRRCEAASQPQSHKAVQTPAENLLHQPHVSAAPPVHTHSQGVSTDADAQLPEYKALFHEIFTCIQKSKEDLRGNRTKPSHVE
ncbi:cerebellar degeneration-related protein 2 [Chanos chanos]|uniref:Cerebellar degeneration-related protein 2 n=1 Tax=Chanos chanos TaxID=29144 RepID=A0A6J2VI49_CHACN|nr:cerebellar degeneration-related protein 2-like [Chanos chanos]